MPDKKEVDPRMHSAEHILTAALMAMTGCGRPFTTHIEKKKSKADYRVGRDLKAKEIGELERRVNEVIRADLPVLEELMPRDMAEKSFSLERLPEVAGQSIRIIRIGDYDACPCIGPHVKTTAEIGGFRIISTAYEDGALRVRFKLEQPPRPAGALAALLIGLLLVFGCESAPPAPLGGSHADGSGFSFAVAGDMRNFTNGAPAGKRYFDGTCEALRNIGPGAFMVSPGDADPPGPVRGTLDQYLGTNYLWYNVAGNHETESAKTMDWLRHWAESGIPHLARRGPPGAEDTTYSFDYGNSHFVMLNEYYDGRSDVVRRDSLPEVLFEWLETDLAATRQPLRWVVAHKPLKSMPDMDTGRLRHGKESVSTNAVQLARFERILKEHKVRAYICGHTHDSSVTKVDGVWQLDSGHARGGGDKGAPSTFLKVNVNGLRTWVDVYRADTNGVHYALRKTVELK